MKDIALDLFSYVVLLPLVVLLCIVFGIVMTPFWLLESR